VKSWGSLLCFFFVFWIIDLSLLLRFLKNPKSYSGLAQRWIYKSFKKIESEHFWTTPVAAPPPRVAGHHAEVMLAIGEEGLVAELLSLNPCLEREDKCFVFLFWCWFPFIPSFFCHIQCCACLWHFYAPSKLGRQILDLTANDASLCCLCSHAFVVIMFLCFFKSLILIKWLWYDSLRSDLSFLINQTVQIWSGFEPNFCTKPNFLLIFDILLASVLKMHRSNKISSYPRGLC